MTREIKFRAWIKSKYQWFVPYKGKSDISKYSWLELIKMYFSKLNHFHSEDVVLMQYTGLKDKNGKEIYEGDVVKWMQTVPWGFGEEEENTREVTFDDKSAGFRPFCGWYVIDNGNLDDNTIAMSSLEYEIIGNIYENPELCKN